MIAFPNAGQLLRYLTKNRATKSQYHNAKRTLECLEKRGYLQLTKDNISLTKLGIEIAEGLVNPTVKPISYQQWDKQWRIVAFDIPEALSPARQAIRMFLKRDTCKMLQKSVYISPFAIEKDIQQLIDLYSIQDYVTCAICKRISNQKKLESKFFSS